ncbi:MAG: hypothetical protein P8144_15030 [Gammaproteobacteria bacterium]
MTNPPKNNLADYWSGIHNALDGRLLSVKNYLKHPSSGFTAENYFRDLLKEYLPRKYSIESGFVVNVAGERSDFLDVLIVDSQNIPPLSAEAHFKVFPSEAVVGAIEITSAPKAHVSRAGIEGNISKLEDDILKLAKLRGIAREREYLVPINTVQNGQVTFKNSRLPYTLSPRCFLITCGDEWVKADTYERNLLSSMNAAKQKNDHVWINAAFSMCHGMFHFKPFTQFEHQRTRENALLEFVLFVNVVVAEFRTSHIDIRRYRPTLPEDSGGQ